MINPLLKTQLEKMKAEYPNSVIWGYVDTSGVIRTHVCANDTLMQGAVLHGLKVYTFIGSTIQRCRSK